MILYLRYFPAALSALATSGTGRNTAHSKQPNPFYINPNLTCMYILFPPNKIPTLLIRIKRCDERITKTVNVTKDSMPTFSPEQKGVEVLVFSIKLYSAFVKDV